MASLDDAALLEGVPDEVVPEDAAVLAMDDEEAAEAADEAAEDAAAEAAERAAPAVAPPAAPRARACEPSGSPRRG